MWNEVERPKAQSIHPVEPQVQPSKSLDHEKLLLLTCPNCEKQFNLRIKAKRIATNICQCPNCNRRITIKCETSTDRVLTTGLYIIGIPALLLIAYSLVDSVMHLIVG